MALDREQHFAEIESQHQDTRRHWRELVETTASEVGQAGAWRPWLPRTSWTGRPLAPDEGPLCDARSDKLGRAVRIVRQSQSFRKGIHAWLTDFDCTASGGPGPTDELNISLTLNEWNAALARIVLRSWMDPDVSVDQMGEIIRDWVYPTPPTRE